MFKVFDFPGYRIGTPNERDKHSVGLDASCKCSSASTASIIAVFTTLLTGLAVADEPNTIYLDETYISGNQELPKVLYILPWTNQQGQVVPASNPAFADRGILKPIYPHEYRREMAYRAAAGAEQSKEVLMERNKQH